MELEQGQNVEFDNGVFKGKGVICGKSNNGLPVIGISYIVEVIQIEPAMDAYPYTHISMFECYIKK